MCYIFLKILVKLLGTSLQTKIKSGNRNIRFVMLAEGQVNQNICSRSTKTITQEQLSRKFIILNLLRTCYMAKRILIHVTYLLVLKYRP